MNSIKFSQHLIIISEWMNRCVCIAIFNLIVIYTFALFVWLEVSHAEGLLRQ